MSNTDLLSDISFYLDNSIFALASSAAHARSSIDHGATSSIAESCGDLYSLACFYVSLLCSSPLGCCFHRLSFPFPRPVSLSHGWPARLLSAAPRVTRLTNRPRLPHQALDSMWYVHSRDTRILGHFHKIPLHLSALTLARIHTHTHIFWYICFSPACYFQVFVI